MDWKKWWPVIFLTGLLVIILAAGFTDQIVSYCFNNGVGLAPDDKEYFYVKTEDNKHYILVTGEGQTELHTGTITPITNRQLTGLLEREIGRNPTSPLKVAKE